MPTTQPDLPNEVIHAVERWEKANGRFVLSRKTAKKALTKLFWKGADPLRILDLLESYCQSPMGPIEEEIPYGRECRNLSKRLVADVNQLKVLKVSVSKSFLTEVEGVSNLLLDYWRESKSPLTPRGSKAVFLVAAAKLVKASTKSRHYPEITKIIHALRPGKKLDPNCISKNVINFERRREFPFMTDSEAKSQARLLDKKWSHLRKKVSKQ